jgi:hypothetical protein
MERPTKERLDKLSESRTFFDQWTQDDIDALFAEIGFLAHNLALSQARERTALRRGFEGALALDDEYRVKFPEFQDFERQVAEGEEHTARMIRLAEAEEKE